MVEATAGSRPHQAAADHPPPCSTDLACRRGDCMHLFRGGGKGGSNSSGSAAVQHISKSSNASTSRCPCGGGLANVVHGLSPAGSWSIHPCGGGRGDAVHGLVLAGSRARRPFGKELQCPCRKLDLLRLLYRPGDRLASWTPLESARHSTWCCEPSRERECC